RGACFGLCRSARNPRFGEGPDCVPVSYGEGLRPDQLTCCGGDLGIACACPDVVRRGTTWKCCTPSQPSEFSLPCWCCPTDCTCDPAGVSLRGGAQCHGAHPFCSNP